MSATVEIQTIEGGRLEWVGIFRAIGGDEIKAAIALGEKIIAGFHGEGSPALRIVDKDGTDIGGWDAR